LHPADSQPVDAWMTIGEITAYSAAWKRGQAWPLAPSPIPVSYLNQSLVLWQGGEEYRYDTNFDRAPTWWVNLPANQFSTNAYPPAFAATATSTNGMAVATMAKVFQPGEPFLVTITVSPATNLLAYTVEDQPPSGWAVTRIDNGGFFDGFRHKVKWGPFFDAAPRTLSYELTPPPEAGDVGTFLGVAAFEDAAVLLGGRRQTISSNSAAGPTLGSASYSPATGFGLLLSGIAGEVYAIEASTNLLDWQPLGALTNLTGSVDFLDSAATNLPLRFYRATWP
jgi:hypothetical protein